MLPDSSEAFLDLVWISSTVQNRNDVDMRLRDKVVNGEREPIHKLSMEAKGNFVNATLRFKGPKIGGNAIDKMIAKSRLLPLIEPCRVDKILTSFISQFDEQPFFP
jgi:hypothetical protein